MASISEKFGQKVRALRRKMGVSQEQLSFESHIDLTSVSEIETGVRNPTLRTIHKIALALKVHTKELFDF